MWPVFRESFVGQIIHNATDGRLLPYPEELPGFIVPPEYRNDGIKASTRSSEAVDSLAPGDAPSKTVVVTWYSPDDPENPCNWPLGRKSWLIFTVMLLTFTVYIDSSIWAPALDVGAEYFGISLTASTLGISMFVLGYAIGPLFLSPISEIPTVGRASPYVVCLFLFCILQIPNAFVTNFPGFLILRFLSGFIGSPPLATGGASLADVLAPHKVPYAMALYGVSAASAPGIGPIVASFAIEARSWRWAFFEMAWLSAASFLVLAVAMPETSSETILYRRAARLRKLTGNPNLRSQGEIDQSHMHPREVLFDALVRPLTMTVTEPIMVGVNLYIGLLYAVLYSFLESFQLAFGKDSPMGYGWSLGVATLPFLAPALGEAIGAAGYSLWNYYQFEPTYLKANGAVRPERNLPMAKYGALLFPVSLFGFAWSAGRTHWIVPVICGVLFGIATDWLFSPLLSYIAFAYPKYAASALASNDFARSIFGAAMPIASAPLFHNLGIAIGNSIMGGLAVLFIPLPFILIKLGPRLRSKSPLCVKDDEITRCADADTPPKDEANAAENGTSASQSPASESTPPPLSPPGSPVIQPALKPCLSGSLRRQSISGSQTVRSGPSVI